MNNSVNSFELENSNEKKSFLKKKSTIIIAVVIFLMLVGAVNSGGEETYEAVKTYETEGIDAIEEIREPAPTYETQINGDYIIGQSPSQYVTGLEEEFVTNQSGVYVAGVDFQPGVYDIVPVSGGGNVQGSGRLNVIMGTDNDDFYTGYYDNKVFQEGNELEVSRVSVRLIPQNNDDYVILPGKYNLNSTYGGGNVFGSGLNEIMGTDNDGFYVKEYHNANLTEGSTLSVSGVKLEVIPVEKEIVVQEAVDAIPAGKVEEKVVIDKEGNITCYMDSNKVECSNLKYYEQLKEEVEEKKK